MGHFILCMPNKMTENESKNVPSGSDAAAQLSHQPSLYHKRLCYETVLFWGSFSRMRIISTCDSAPSISVHIFSENDHSKRLH